MAESKAQVDWERIEAEYRAGVLSLREISSRHEGVNHVAIARKAKKEGWVRDLRNKIINLADDLVTKQTVTASVTKEASVTEKSVVEANAQAIADVRLSHRADISRNKKLCLNLLEELESQTINRELYEQLGELLSAPDEKGVDKLNELYRKVVSTPSRIDSMKKLADTIRTLITLEREAWGIIPVEKDQAASSTATSADDCDTAELVRICKVKL